jgi:hypothetical protein
MFPADAINDEFAISKPGYRVTNFSCCAGLAGDSTIEPGGYFV